MSDVARPAPKSVHHIPVTWNCGFAVVFLVALAALGPLRDTVFFDPFSRLTREQVHEARAGWEGPDASRAAGGVFSLDSSVRDALCGTLVAGDGAFIGEIRISCAAPGGARLVLPVTGRTSAPNSLSVRALDDEGRLLGEITHPGHDFNIEVGRWDFEVPERTARLEVVMIDSAAGHGAWLGVGRPVSAAAAARDPLLRPMVNIGFFFAHAVALAGFLFIPGMALRASMRSLVVPVALLPLAGFGLAAATGLAIWLAGPSASGVVATVYKLLHVALAILVIARRAPRFDADERHAARLYWAVVAVTLAWSIVPLAVEKEFFVGTNARGRMVASPPDSMIPFFTAAYFLDDSDGGADQERYFGREWTATSRGPLSAWVTLAGLIVFDIKPGEPPLIAPNAWPADSEGHFVSRIAGIFTNAFVILGAFAVLRVFAPGRHDLVWFGLGWVALSPVVMINTAFLWPKMLATYFGMLAIVEVAGKRRGPETGLWLALAYLSHPVGVLIAAPVLVWSGVLAARGAWLFRVRVDRFFFGMAWRGLWMIVFASPWLLFKFLNAKHDVFFRYPFGDGRGFETAASVGSWFACRWDNIWYSLVPGTLWDSQLLVHWAGGSLSLPGHWAMNCAKTLPFGVGIAMFLLVVRWLWVRSNGTLAWFRICVLGGGFLLMVAVWGFSRDGLGRNCLEPLVVFAMIATAAVMPRVTIVARVLAALLAVEAIALLVLAYLANPGFRAADAPPVVWVMFGVTGVAGALLAWVALSRRHAEDVTEDAR